MASVPTSIQPAAAKYKRPRLPSDVPDFGKEAEYFISYNRFHFKSIPASRVRLGGCFADVFISLFKGDTTVGDSTYWEAGLTQSDVTQANNVMSENIRSDGMHLWHHKQTDNSSSNGISRNPTDGSWLSSPHSSGPSHLCQDISDDSKSVAVSAWPISKTHSEILNNNDHLTDQVVKENKAEAAASCRLFGIDLNDPRTNTQKVSEYAANVFGVTSEGCVATPMSRTDADKNKFDISKASKERKQEQLPISPNETQSKQTNSRSCTKVLVVYCLFTW